MTQAKLEAMFQAIDATDWGRAAELWHPEMEYDRPGFPLLVGKDAVHHFYRAIRMIRGRHEFEAFVIEGDRGACWGRFVGQTVAGKPVDVQFADCYRFKDSLLWRRKSYFFVPSI